MPFLRPSPGVPAIETACALYETHGLLLAQDLQNYLRHPAGYVVKTPEMLLLYRPVVLDDPDRWLEHTGEANAWYVRLLVSGRGIETALREMPYRLPFCCWHRNFRAGPNGHLHVVSTDKIIQKVRQAHG